MSRHRNFRNVSYDDYDDGYYDDDYYDEEDDDYYDETYSYSHQQKQKQQQQQSKQPQARTTTTTAKPAAKNNNNSNKLKGGVTVKAAAAPPPGFGNKPSTAAAPTAKYNTTTSVQTSSSSAGVSKPPPNWGKPSTKTTVQNTSSAATNTAAAAAAGIKSPPPGWGIPTPTAAASPTKPSATGSTSSTAATGQQQSKGTSKTGTIFPSSATYKPKPLPDVLKREQSQKSQLSMVVLGHVDAGKSTLMGQLLVQVGQVSKRDASKNQNLSWLLDENESERTRGVTMEIATKSFKVTNHDIVLLDAPGHADFIPIMITGAASADVAILVVASVTGEFEAGFDRGGQTKEHVLLARGLGVSQVIVAINKLDVGGWSQTRYEEIQSKVREYLQKQQFAPKRIKFVPLSGLTGENVQSCNDTKLKSWYKGPTLLQAINDFQPANRQLEKPLRFIVTDVFAEGKGVTTRGRVVQGFLQIGERLLVSPIGDAVTVNKVEHLQAPSDSDPRRLAIAIAGDTVELVLLGIDIMRISVGSILSHVESRPPICKRFQAKILVMDQLAVPIIKGAQILFHMHSLDVPAVMNKLIAITKRDGTIKKERPRALPGGSSAIVELTMSDKLVLEPFSDCRALGRFVLRRSGDTIAVGVIDKLMA